MTSVLPGSRPIESDDSREADVAFAADFDEAFDAMSADGDVLPVDGDVLPAGRDVLPAGGDAMAAEDGTAEPEPGTDELTERQRNMLIFERQWWRHAGSKEQSIREQFGLSATRYYQALNALLDAPAAVAFDPIVVGRLRRLRATRARKRAGR